MSITGSASSVVIGAITASGLPVIQAICSNGETETTHSSFHRIESFGKFSAVESNEQTFESVHQESIQHEERKEQQTELPTGEVDVEKNMHSEQAQAEQELSPLNSPSATATAAAAGSAAVADEGVPIASSGQFDRKRTASLAAAILTAESSPGSKPTVQFVGPAGGGVHPTLIEAFEGEEGKTAENEQLPSSEAIIASLLLTLRSLQMNDKDRYASAVRRLQDLEQELRAAGAICPPDLAVSDSVAKALASAGPNSDVQIRVNSSRHTTTTKTVFESETPGMQGLDAETVQRLQQQLLSNLSSVVSPPSATTQQPAAQPATDQKHESVAEGFTSEDGSTVVSKKMTRVVTTTRTTLPGETAAEPSAGGEDLIRLKVNEQVYSGSVDPNSQHIHLVPITKSDQSSQHSQQPQ